MNNNTGAEGLIARTWRGATRREDGPAYLTFLLESGLRDYRATPGNRGVIALSRPVEDRVEFLLVSLWESEQAIRKFAGSDIQRAVFYPRDDDFLVQRDLTVNHYEVLFRDGLER